MRYKVGDLIQLIPSNCPDDFYEGRGLILDNSDGKYYILFYDLKKTSRKRLYTIDFGQMYYHFDIDVADKHELFKVLA